MASLAYACTQELEILRLGVTRTDTTVPFAMVTEICAALTIISLLPRYHSLHEIELSFDVRGEETEEKLMRALVGTREHWKWIDQKLASEFLHLHTLTIRFEDNCGECIIHDDFQNFDSAASQAIPFDSEDDITDGPTQLRRKLVEFECVHHGDEQTWVTHPMQLCQFHDAPISIDPEQDFFKDVFAVFFAETMVHLAYHRKISVINGVSLIRPIFECTNGYNDFQNNFQIAPWI